MRFDLLGQEEDRLRDKITGRLRKTNFLNKKNIREIEMDMYFIPELDDEVGEFYG
jgi:hypothetical protein